MPSTKRPNKTRFFFDSEKFITKDEITNYITEKFGVTENIFIAAGKDTKTLGYGFMILPAQFDGCTDENLVIEHHYGSENKKL